MQSHSRPVWDESVDWGQSQGSTHPLHGVAGRRKELAMVAVDPSWWHSIPPMSGRSANCEGELYVDISVIGRLDGSDLQTAIPAAHAAYHVQRSEGVSQSKAWAWSLFCVVTNWAWSPCLPLIAIFAKAPGRTTEFAGTGHVPQLYTCMMTSAVVGDPLYGHRQGSRTTSSAGRRSVR